MTHRISILLLACAVALMCGCTTKKKSKRDTRSAYMMGRQQGIIHAQQKQLEQNAQNTLVTFSGDVSATSVKWNEELTLSQAIVEAEFRGRRNPKAVFIRRGDSVFEVKPWQLLRGNDYLLEPGDHVEIR